MDDGTVETLSARARGWRTAAVATGLALLGYGTVAGHDGMFPFGPMVQYAFYIDPDGEVVSTRVEADTTDGRRVVVHLSPSGVGIRRADIEGQLSAIVDDPSRLRAIAVGQRRLHPEQPQFTQLYVVQDVTRLRDGRVLGTETRLVTSWRVPGR